MAISFGPKLGLMVNGVQGEEHYEPLMKLLRAIDALVQPTVLTHTLTEAPSSPADGDCHIVGAGASGGDWGGMGKSIARYSTVVPGWEFFTPKEGWLVYSEEEAGYMKYMEGNWVTFDTAPTPPPVVPLAGFMGSAYLNPVGEFNPGRTGGSTDSGSFYTAGLVYGNARSTGKRYAEFRLQDSITSPANFIAGFQTQDLLDNFNEGAHSIAAYIWNGGVFRMDSKFYALDGTLVLDGSGPAGVLAPYDLLGIAVDLDAGKLWYRIEEGSWFGGGDPATGTGGITVSSGGVPLIPVMAMLEAGLQVAINTVELGYSAPAGFIPWDQV